MSSTRIARAGVPAFVATLMVSLSVGAGAVPAMAAQPKCGGDPSNDSGDTVTTFTS